MAEKNPSKVQGFELAENDSSVFSHTSSRNSQNQREIAAARRTEDCSGSGAIPVEAWLPITESRNGNVYTATFHLLCSGFGFQLLLLPSAFAVLGWIWGVICLSVGFIWQLYTTWLLVHLHESVPGTRFSRYLRLAIAAFGVKLGKLLGIFPVMYLSGGTSVLLIITGGKTMQQLYFILSENDNVQPLSSVQWFLVFTFTAVVLAQFPNLNSLSGISLIGGVMGVAFCTLIWALPVAQGRPKHGVSYSYDTREKSFTSIFNAIGFIALSFRGHNLVLEIQGTLPSNSKNPSSKTMWRAVIISYTFIAMSMFPLSIGAYWAYGNMIPTSGGNVTKYLKLYGQDFSKLAACFIHLAFILFCLFSFPITTMPAYDNLELMYITKRQKPCSFFARTTLRVLSGGLYFFVAVTFPFLPYLAVLVGGIALSLTFTYPCFMWNSIKRPSRMSVMWCINVVIGCLGVCLSILPVIAAAFRLADRGLHANFFKP